MSKVRLISDLIKLFFEGYNPLVKSLSYSGLFFLDISNKYGVVDIILLIDKSTNKKNRIISELMFLNRKNKLNVRVLNLDKEKFSPIQFKKELVISFVDTDALDEVIGAFLLTEEYIEKEKSVFSGFFADDYYISIFDKEVYYSLNGNTVKINFKIQAIITCYNEEDVIWQTIEYLTKQGIQVHVIDNWSLDNSGKIIEKAVLANTMVTSEKFPKDGPSDTYDWKDLLTRVQDYAMEHCEDFDWFIHHDADEIREAPFRESISLWDGIQVADDLGYSAIDHTVINFALTKDGFDGTQRISEYFKYFEFGLKKNYHHKQIKAWKSVNLVDLASSGGHEAIFDGREVFPYKFLLKHYPLRSVSQAKRKVFEERKARWNKEERANKWHKQYDEISEQHEFLISSKDLIKYNRKEIYKKHLLKLIFGLFKK